MQDRVRGLFVAAACVLGERPLCLLKALGRTASSLDRGPLGWVEVLLCGAPTDAGGLLCCGSLLL
ncbi:MAG TPA: hypothetical protein VIC05_01295 [Solirubrobacteraceae bacterium]